MSGKEQSQHEQYEQVFRHLAYTMKHLNEYAENRELFETARDEAVKAARNSRDMDAEVAREMSGLLNDLYRKAYGETEESATDAEESWREFTENAQDYTVQTVAGGSDVYIPEDPEKAAKAADNDRESHEAAREMQEYEEDKQTIQEAWKAVRYLAPDPEADGDDPTYQ